MPTQSARRRRLAPAATMVFSAVAAVALLGAFVVQVIAEAPSRALGAIPGFALQRIDDAFTSPHSGQSPGELRPETVTLLERTDDGVVALAFLSTTNALGVGVYTETGGGATSLGSADSGANWVRLQLPVEGKTVDYQLSVRKIDTGSGFEHTFIQR